MGAYLHRIAKTLIKLGHKPIVFTLTEDRTETLEFERIHVERVKLPKESSFQYLNKFISSGLSLIQINDLVGYLCGARLLARAFYEQDREKPFDFLHSSDYGLSGLFIRRQRNRPHLVRCSWAGDLFIQVDGKFHLLNSKLYCLFERYCIRKADVAYAPSEFVSNYFRKQHRLPVRVLRPPFMMDIEPSKDLPWELPRRFLMYFGAINQRKGTDVLAKALPLVWQEEPEFTMVWAGESWNGAVEKYCQMWGERSSCVKSLGYIEKSQVFALLKSAEAVVIPSRVDNLPNTLIESILMKVPVIGSDGASIDELVEPGKNGDLVPIGDSVALADAMLRCWRREAPWTKLKYQLSPVIEQMTPDVAACNLLKLAGFAN